MSGTNSAASLQLLQGQRARTVVLLGKVLQSLDNLSIVAQAEEVLGCLLQSNNGNSKNRHGKDDGTTSKHDISPAIVVGLGASFHRGAVPLLRDKETPRNETGDGLANTPPSGEESQKPLLVAGKVFEEDGGIHDKVAAATKTNQSREDTEGCPRRHGTSKDTASGADEEREVEGPLATDDVGTEAPEDGANKQTDVGCEVQALIVTNLAELEEGLGGNNGLEEGDHGIDGVTMRHICQ